MALRINGATADGGRMGRRDFMNVGKKAGLPLDARKEFARFGERRGSLGKGDMQRFFKKQIALGHLDARDAARAGSHFGLPPSARHFDSPTVETKPLRREERKPPTPFIREAPESPDAASDSLPEKLY